MTRLDKEQIIAALRAEDVAAHLGISGLFDQKWRGQWMRSRRCPQTDHPSEAFGLKRDGHWHCHACDIGGDLLALIAAAENLDQTRDFQRILEIAAEIAGLDDSPPDFFGGETKPSTFRERPALPPAVPIEQRVAAARKRAAWVWERLWTTEEMDLPILYLRSRGIPADVIQSDILNREELRSTPLRLTPQLRAEIARGGVSGDVVTLWATMGTKPDTLSMVVPVRSVHDGALVDLRARRVAPAAGRPKIIGMVGGVTAAPAEKKSPRYLVGCYGHPHRVESDHVIVVEGAMDYLTALAVWRNCQPLGAVEAGSFSLVAGHAAAALAARDNESVLTIVEQNDPPRTLHDGRVVAGAADAATNEEPNAALKVALRHLGPDRVRHLRVPAPYKDLNDLVMLGVDPTPLMKPALQ